MYQRTLVKCGENQMSNIIFHICHCSYRIDPTTVPYWWPKQKYFSHMASSMHDTNMYDTACTHSSAFLSLLPSLSASCQISKRVDWHVTIIHVMCTQYQSHWNAANRVIIGSGNGLLHVWPRAIAWTNDKLLSVCSSEEVPVCLRKCSCNYRLGQFCLHLSVLNVHMGHRNKTELSIT